MNADPPVVQICQPGFDIRNCPDWAYLFNSNWPSLGIAFETTINNSTFTVPHNLGYYPLVIGWALYSGPKSYGRVPPATFSVDKVNVYINIPTGTNMTIRCYNVDISKEQLYPLPQSAQAKLPYNNQWGLKVLKQDKPTRVITSNNLNDFIIHTRGQSPAVLAVATQAGKFYTTSSSSQYTGPYIVFPLQTSYVPFVMGCWKLGSGRYQFVTINGVQQINNTVVFPFQGNTAGSLIVLRDPLFYPNVRRVVY